MVSDPAMAGYSRHLHLWRAPLKLQQRAIRIQRPDAVGPSAVLMGLLFSTTLLFPGSLPAASKANQDSGQVPVQGSTPNPGYRLAPNDVIKVQVFGEEALTTETRVSGDGKIALPLLGVLEIKGLTVKETEELIASRLADGYLKHPRVSIY